jgi:hypothetical protein
MQKLSAFKKTLLFLNASSFKLASVGSWKDAFYNQTESTALIFNWCLEFSLFKLFFIKMDRLPSFFVAFLLAAPFIFHLGISFIFSTDLKLIKDDYKSYYARSYYVTYSIFAVIGMIFALYYLFCIW